MTRAFAPGSLRHLPLLGLLLSLPAAVPVRAQSPAPTPAAPAAAEPTRAPVEKYVPELKSYLDSRETSMTRRVNEITALDQPIQAPVQKVPGILTAAKDSKETRTKVTKLKEETLAGLKRAAQAYAQKRSQIAEELRTTKNDYRRGDLFTSRGQIDTRIDNMVDAMVKLALSMETDEGHERYLQDSSVPVGGRWGVVVVPTTKRNPDYDQNKRQAAQTEKVTNELDKAFDPSLQRLDAQDRGIVAKPASPAVSEADKTRLLAELERIKTIREERLRQRTLLDSGGGEGMQTGFDHKEFMETGELVENITSGARRDFTRMMAAFNELRTERQALATLKAKLDHAEQWLESHPAFK
jgi:hypothetical protein